jgi:hypothetical protein
MSYIRLEVRCCCKPEKLMGWLCVTEEQVTRRRINVPVLNTYLSMRRFQVPHNSDPVTFPIAELALSIADINRHGHRYLAIKGDETSINTFERVPGFERNPNYIE